MSTAGRHEASSHRPASVARTHPIFCFMKRAQFFKPGSILIERQVPREGPSPVFIAWKPNAQSFVDEKALLKFAAYPKSDQQALTFGNGYAVFDGTPLEKPELDTLPEIAGKASALRLRSWTPRQNKNGGLMSFNLENFFEFYEGLPHQKEGIALLHQTMPSSLLSDSPWVKA